MSMLVLDGNRRLMDEARPGGSARPPRVSIKDGRFTLYVPGQNTIELPFDAKGAFVDIVIVDVNQKTSKLYWGPQRLYDPNSVKPPVCWSDTGIAPSAGAAEPQSPTCGTCPQNVWGSAVNGKGNKVKACEDFKKMAVLVRGYPGLYLFEIKPGSFKAWTAYTGMLSMHKLPKGGRPDLYHLITRVRFAGTGILSFEPVDWTENDQVLTKQVLDTWESNKQNDLSGMMIGRYDEAAQNVIPIAQQKEAEARGMPAQAPLPPPPVDKVRSMSGPPPLWTEMAQAQPQAFVLSGANPAGPLFPQQPPQQHDEATTKTRGRPKKTDAPQTQPAPPMQLAQQAAPQGIASPADDLPGGISNRLRSLFPQT